MPHQWTILALIKEDESEETFDHGFVQGKVNKLEVKEWLKTVPIALFGECIIGGFLPKFQDPRP